MKSLTIGQLAKRAGVGVEAIRFYERRGLMPEPPRRPSGYREYPEDAVERLAFIRHAKELGFSLGEVKELLCLRVDRGSACGAVSRRAEAKLADIEARIRSLQRMRRALRKLVQACEERRPTADCPILEAMERG